MTKRQYIKSVVDRKKAYENRYTPVFYKAIRATKAPVIKIAKEDGLLQAMMNATVITDRHFEAAVKELYRNVGPKEASWAYKELLTYKDRKAGFGAAIDFLSDILDFLDSNILDKVVRELTATTMERIYRVIVNGNAAGDSYDQIIAKLEDTELDRVRARLIARTESNRATNAGHDIGRKAYPYQVDKTWLAARDRRTRGAEGDDKADHFHMNGLIVAENAAFTDPRSGAQLMYPGDSTLGAGAKDVCNCRCNVRFIPKRDANGRLMLRQEGLRVPI